MLAHLVVTRNRCGVGLVETLVLLVRVQPQQCLAPGCAGRRRLPLEGRQTLDALAPGCLVVGQQLGVGQLCRLVHRLVADDAFQALTGLGAVFVETGQGLVVLQGQVGGRPLAAEQGPVAVGRFGGHAAPRQQTDLRQPGTVHAFAGEGLLHLGDPRTVGMGAAQALQPGLGALLVVLERIQGHAVERRFRVRIDLQGALQRLTGHVRPAARTPELGLLDQDLESIAGGGRADGMRRQPRAGTEQRQGKRLEQSHGRPILASVPGHVRAIRGRDRRPPVRKRDRAGTPGSAAAR
ncbi:hypothetical protein FQZ97_437950 [compost metagenome]